MSIEASFLEIIGALCPRVNASVAPFGTALPRVVYQHIGGRTLRSLANEAADKRNILLQVSSWADSASKAFTLARSIEDGLCASTVLIVTPQGEPIAGVADDGDPIFGAVQTFSIWGLR